MVQLDSNYKSDNSVLSRVIMGFMEIAAIT
jgi:hypothetical protein